MAPAPSALTEDCVSKPKPKRNPKHQSVAQGAQMGRLMIQNKLVPPWLAAIAQNHSRKARPQHKSDSDPTLHLLVQQISYMVDTHEVKAGPCLLICHSVMAPLHNEVNFGKLPGG